jgi:hypothetical protein
VHRVVLWTNFTDHDVPYSPRWNFGETRMFNCCVRGTVYQREHRFFSPVERCEINFHPANSIPDPHKGCMITFYVLKVLSRLVFPITMPVLCTEALLSQVTSTIQVCISGTAGGPAIKHGLSFFGAHEGFREMYATPGVEAFNLTNTPVFAEPSQMLASPTFGVFTAEINSPRQMQLASRLEF